METRNRKLLHSSPMEDDRISILPEELLCHILCFLPTKQSVATSVLSKKWESLWRSVTTLDFDDDEYFTVRKKKEVYAPFVESVYKVMFSRKIHQSIKKFRLRCTHRHFYDPINVSIWVNSAVKRRVQHLDICLGKHLLRKSLTNLSSIFTCTTLVVLKLRGTKLEPISSGSVHLPFLKLLHLHDLYFSKRACLAALLSGCPILEDFKATFLLFHEDVSFKKPLPALQQPSHANTEFKTLPKLLRAHLSETIDNFLLEVVSNVKFLHIDKIDGSLADDTDTDPCVFPMFHNLTRIKLFYSTCNDDWSEVVELLKNCPKLQVLVINQPHFIMNELDLSEETANWQYPPSVPKCILSHLKTCYLNDYRGTKGGVRFARYIMRNGRVLESMTVCCGIRINQPRKLEMLTKLSSCTRRSKTCKLSFK